VGRAGSTKTHNVGTLPPSLCDRVDQIDTIALSSCRSWDKETWCRSVRSRERMPAATAELQRDRLDDALHRHLVRLPQLRDALRRADPTARLPHAARLRTQSLVTRFGRCRMSWLAYIRAVDEVERLLRRLALNDEKSIEMVLVRGGDTSYATTLTPKDRVLVRLGALLALGAATTSLQATVEAARGFGATEAEVVGVLVAVAPAIGLVRIVANAPRLAAAIGYDLDDE
jgi:4-carboxymuconolactone decarboxylase